MAILFALTMFVCAAACVYGAAIIIHRQSTLKAMQGQSYRSYKDKIRDLTAYIMGGILELNKRLTKNKKYQDIWFNIQKLGMEDRFSREYFLFLQEISGLAALLAGIMLLKDAVYCLAALGTGVIGFLAPEFWLRYKIGEKQEMILKELPDAIDIITASIEGGLSLSQAISRYAQENYTESKKVKNDLAKEITATMQKIQLGKSFEDAMIELSAKWNIKEMDSFTAVFIQADKMGGNVKGILRAQAEEMRNKRFQTMKKKAYEAPVKLLIPLLIFIFPVVFIVLFGPIVIKLMQGF